MCPCGFGGWWYWLPFVGFLFDWFGIFFFETGSLQYIALAILELTNVDQANFQLRQICLTVSLEC